MAQVKLLGYFSSPFSQRVEWALKHKGIEYEFIVEDPRNKSASLVEYNPVYKKIPVLLHNGKPIVESLLILEYIEETWKENPLLPEDPYEKANARFWAKFAEEKCMDVIRTALRSVGKEQEKAIESAKESLKILDGQLKEKKYFDGERFGFTDLVIGWIPRWFYVIEEAAGFKLLDPQSFPYLCSWCENFVEVPLIKQNLPSHEELIPIFHAARKRILSSAATS